MKVTAQYIGRRNYKVTAKRKDGEILQKTFKEPFLKDPKDYQKEISKLYNEFVKHGFDINGRDLYNRIKIAAESEGREFPNLLV